jgi:hypothetical protein
MTKNIPNMVLIPFESMMLVTGAPGTGKTTKAEKIAEWCRNNNIKAQHLDGDSAACVSTKNTMKMGAERGFVLWSEVVRFMADGYFVILSHNNGCFAQMNGYLWACQALGVRIQVHTVLPTESFEALQKVFASRSEHTTLFNVSQEKTQNKSQKSQKSMTKEDFVSKLYSDAQTSVVLSQRELIQATVERRVKSGEISDKTVKEMTEIYMNKVGLASSRRLYGMLLSFDAVTESEIRYVSQLGFSPHTVDDDFVTHTEKVLVPATATMMSALVPSLKLPHGKKDVKVFQQRELFLFQDKYYHNTVLYAAGGTQLPLEVAFAPARRSVRVLTVSWGKGKPSIAVLLDESDRKKGNHLTIDATMQHFPAQMREVSTNVLEMLPDNVDFEQQNDVLLPIVRSTLLSMNMTLKNKEKVLMEYGPPTNVELTSAEFPSAIDVTLHCGGLGMY